MKDKTGREIQKDDIACLGCWASTKEDVFVKLKNDNLIDIKTGKIMGIGKVVQLLEFYKESQRSK